MFESVKLAIDKLNMESLSTEDKLKRLSLIDHFHGGGLWSTETLMNLMETKFKQQKYGIDIGCGMGGPMRWFAYRAKCHMTGVDITPEFLRIAEYITEKLNMKKSCDYFAADACSLPTRKKYDFAIMMAVTCNIANRKALYDSINKVLKTNSKIGVIDLVKGKNPGLVLPVPWSTDGKKETSFLLSEAETIEFAKNAGFSLMKKKDISKEVLDWFKKEHRALSKNRKIGFEVVLPEWPKMVKSQVRNLEKDHIRFMDFVFAK